MIPEYLKKNLDLFRAGEYSLVLNKGETVFIEEDAEEGRAGLEGFFENDAIVFHFPEKRTLPYLDANKKACQCADKFIFIRTIRNCHKYALTLAQTTKGEYPNGLQFNKKRT